MKTPQQIKRQNVRELFERVLQSQALEISPHDISVKESWSSDFTCVELAINETIGGVRTCREITEDKAKGFVDGIFKACHSQYVSKNPSLRNIRLVDYQVKPEFVQPKNSMGADAKTTVSLTMEVRARPAAEFKYTSRSILYSSLAATLEAFQFYINCDKAFKKIRLIMSEAESRNRADIVQKCLSDLHFLTTVNSYDN